MEVEDLVKSYDGNEPVLADVRFRLEKGEHVAVVGVNGAGKSTFARILAGVEPYDSGTCEAGSKVEIGYFAQDHADSLDKKLDVLEMASEGIRGEAAGKVRDMLGAFLFRGNDVYKKVSVLSGGERGRLALLHMLLQPANFLILDEPTNHLDMASQGVLQKAIKNYEGACLIVSHNRDFLDPIVSKVLEFRVGEPPRLYLGNVSDYIEKKAAEEKQQIQSQSAQTSEPSKPQEQDDEDPRLAGLSKKERRQRAAQIRQERSEKLNPLQKELETVEEQIAVLEQEKISLTKLFQEQSEASENEKGEKVQELSEKYRACEEQLQSNYSRWSKLSEEIESFEASAWVEIKKGLTVTVKPFSQTIK